MQAFGRRFILLEIFADRRTLEAQLPDGQEDVVEELKTDAATKACFGSTTDAVSSTPHCGVAVPASASSCSQDINKRV